VKAGVTWLVVGAVAVVGLAATVDALRGTPDPRPPSTTESTTEAETGGDAGGLHGVLYYTDEDDCVLHGARLPELDEVQAQPWGGCGFSLSPDGVDLGVAGTVWDRRGNYSAGESGGVISLRSVVGDVSVVIRGTAPAFTRFGNLTFARDGAIHVGDPVCLLNEQGSFEPCSRVTVRASQLRRTIRGHPSVPDGPGFVRDVTIDEAVWLDADRLVLLVGADIRFVGQFEAVALVGDQRGVRVVEGGIGADFGSLEASPGGRYFAVSTTTSPGLRILSREGDALSLPPLTEPHAIAWSPGDTWTAVATRASIQIFNAGRPGSRVRRLPIAAADLAWR
jgi:hypothetical protein